MVRYNESLIVKQTGGKKLTKLERASQQKFGSMRKLAKAINVTPSCVHQVNAGYRKAWPKLRQQLSIALEVAENELFDEKGWPIESKVVFFYNKIIKYKCHLS